MTDSTGSHARSDPATLRARYEEEIAKRLVEGRATIRDLTTDEVFSKYREDPFTPVARRNPVIEELDVAVIGAGMAGVVAGAQLRKVGMQRIRLIDKAGGIGGTWYWNRYPGVMCDVESYCYLPMLEDVGYVPKHRYAYGEEIRQHLENLARRFDLLDAALFHTGVLTSAWDEERAHWVLRTDRGDELRAKYLVMAVGILNLFKLPAIPGMEDFQGASFHTARWDFEYTGGSPAGNLTKLADKVAGIIGTGASGVQCIPHLAEGAKELYVFQRTPAAVGVRGQCPTTDEIVATMTPGWQRKRMENFQAVMLGRPVDVDMVDDGWCHHYGPLISMPRRDGMSDEEYLAELERFDFEVMELHRRRIREIVRDPAKVEALMPYYRYACRRPLFHDDYLAALDRPNVTVVECPTGIDRITAAGVVVGGKEYALDCIVYATGFEAEATALPRRAGHDIRGRGGQSLAEKWAEGPSTLFGMMTNGFPNLFIMPAPGQQAVVTVNHTLITVVGAEHIAATVAGLEERGVRWFEVTEEAEADWVQTIVEGATAGARAVMATLPCIPSTRVAYDGTEPAMLTARSGSYGGAGLGDYFAFTELLASWRDAGDFAGLRLVLEQPSSRAVHGTDAAALGARATPAGDAGAR